MASTARDDESRHHSRDIDEDDTLTEVGSEDRDFTDLDEETDAIDRRRDPLRTPH